MRENVTSRPPTPADEKVLSPFPEGCSPRDPGSDQKVNAMPRRHSCGLSLLAPTLLLWSVSGEATAQGAQDVQHAQEVGASRVAGQPAQAILAAARQIDKLVEADLAAHQQRPNPVVDDATYVRRAYLGIVGRIPTLAEIEAFQGSHESDRRRRLVDHLLDSPGYTSHMFNYWADLLRVKTRLAQQTSGGPYIHWLKTAIGENAPYDRFVSELLTASGAAHERGNGATGYYLRDRGMPEDNMSNTVRVFLGTRLECAQCHNHPFDQWTQKQFFEMAAFTGGIRYADDGAQQDRRQNQEIARQLRDEHGPQAQRALRRLMQPVTVGISGTGAGLAQLPKDYQYDDAEPTQLVKAHAMFGEDPGVEPRVPRSDQRRNRGRRPAGQNRRTRGPRLPEIGSREAYAAWLTSPDNPRFTAVIANRMWKRVMGLGLIEPVDNITEETVASNPALLAYLEELMVDLDYDLVQFQRVLGYTQVAQRAAAQRQPAADETYRFAGPVLRRMSAEQIWDSVLTLVVPDLDGHLDDPAAQAEPVYRSYERLSSLSGEELSKRVAIEVLRYTDPARYQEMRREERMETSQQQRRVRAQGQREVRDLRRELARARRAGDDERVAELMAELQEITVQRGRRRGAGASRLARASDLPSPAPPGHLLGEFGQSDREQIEASHAEANVPQVLTLLNGFVEQSILRPESLLTRALDAAPSTADKIRTAYRAILGRDPSSAEVRLWTADHKQLRDQMQRDLVWTLLNTNEFRFVQ